MTEACVSCIEERPGDYMFDMLSSRWIIESNTSFSSRGRFSWEFGVIGHRTYHKLLEIEVVISD